MRGSIFLLLAIALAQPLQGAQAQSYPSRPIRFVAPQPPGGGGSEFGVGGFELSELAAGVADGNFSPKYSNNSARRQAALSA